MAESKVDVGGAIRYGWENFKKEPWYFIGLAVVTTVLTSIGNDRDTQTESTSIIGFLLSAWLTPGYLKLVLAHYEGSKLPFIEVFKQGRYFWRILGANILLSLIFIVGFILLIIPGIYLILRYQFTWLLIVDKDLGIFEAMGESSKITKGKKLDLFLFGLAALGIMILGALALGVGIFVAIPVLWLAHVYLYKHLEIAAVSQ